MATEFDDSEHWGFFLTGQKLTSETGKYVRMSSLVLAALRSTGVFSSMEDGTVAPATDKLWLDKNTDPPTLKEWDATGASWVPMTYGRLFGQAAVGLLTVTGGTGNAVVISAPTGFQANRLYLITPTATNTGAATIQVAGVGTFNVKYGDGSDIVAGELTAERQTALFFDGVKFLVILAVGSGGILDGSVTTPKLADGVLSADASGRAKMADGFLSADATGRAKVADGFVNTAKIASGALSADATGRGKVADGFLSADAAGRAKMADGFVTAAKAADDIVSGQTSKATVVDADEFLIGDSAASGAKKRAALSALWAWAQAKILALFNVSGSAPVYACRAWVNFNGTGTVAIRASGNVTSITDNGTGDYTVNFTTNMQDSNYGFAITAGRGASSAEVTTNINTSSTPTAAALRFGTTTGAGTLSDCSFVSVSIFR